MSQRPEFTRIRALLEKSGGNGSRESYIHNPSYGFDLR